MQEPTPAGKALLETFPAIRIINLKSRPDRRREMISEFSRLGLVIDGEKIGFHDASVFNDAEPFPSVGARGCFHSHMTILEEALTKKFDSVLIFEDDCDFIGNIEDILPRVMSSLRGKTWGMFYGGHDLIFEASMSGSLREIKPGTWMCGAHFVAFHKEAIQALVPYLQAEIKRLENRVEGASKGIDGTYSHFTGEFPEYSCFVSCPTLGYQRPSPTNISNLSTYDRFPLVTFFLYPVRKVKRFLKKRST